MTLSFTNVAGNLFPRLGKVGLVVKTVKSAQGTLQTNLIDTTAGLFAQLQGEPDVAALVGDGYIGALNGIEDPETLVQIVARAVVNRMVFRDTPQPNQSLTQQNVQASLLEIIRQMKATGNSVLAMTITAIPNVTNNPGPHFSGTGNGVLVLSTKRALDGLVLENTFAETLIVTCTTDSYTGGATLNNETLTVTGEATTDVFDFNWPLGSGCQVTVQAVDGGTDAGSGNLLTNSGFDSFTNNVPNNWTLLSGTAGTHVFQETGLIYRGAAALKLVGDGSTLVALKQQFASASGTTGTLLPLTQYAFNVYMRRGGAAVTGQLTFALVDDNDLILTDAAGTVNSVTIDLSTLGTSYGPQNVCFCTPSNMPTSYYLKIFMPAGQPLSNNGQVYLDLAALGTTTQLYTGGPSITGFAGSIPFVALPTADRATVLVSNSRGAGGTLSTFQTLMYQLFPEFIQAELLLPSSAVPTISDGLIA